MKNIIGFIREYLWAIIMIAMLIFSIRMISYNNYWFLVSQLLLFQWLIMALCLEKDGEMEGFKTVDIDGKWYRLFIVKFHWLDKLSLLNMSYQVFGYCFLLLNTIIYSIIYSNKDLDTLSRNDFIDEFNWYLRIFYVVAIVAVVLNAMFKIYRDKKAK